MKFSVVLAAGLIGLVGAGTAMASSITGDRFTFSFNGATPADVDAGAAGRDLRLFSPYRIELDWIDGDSFDFSQTGEAGDYFFELAGLDFSDGSGAAYEIAGVRFNYGDSDIDSYFEDPVNNPTGAPRSDFSDPVISFTGSSISINQLGLGNQLGGDGLTFRFDVTLTPVGGPPPPAIPLPAPALLLLGALGGLGAMRRLT